VGERGSRRMAGRRTVVGVPGSGPMGRGRRVERRWVPQEGWSWMLRQCRGLRLGLRTQTPGTAQRGLHFEARWGSRRLR
jgi:hypothetical protein